VFKTILFIKKKTMFIYASWTNIIFKNKKKKKKYQLGVVVEGSRDIVLAWSLIMVIAWKRGERTYFDYSSFPKNEKKKKICV
jgi:hypothetical protein